VGRATIRTFFAIEIPEQLGRELRALQAELSPDLPGWRFTRNTPFHVTLAFLGDVPDHDLARLQERVAENVVQFEPCEFQIKGLGAFPSPGRPRVLWAGLSASQPETLCGIQKAVRSAAVKAGYLCEDERFHPHVTLGRFKAGRRGSCDLTPIVERYRSWSCGGSCAQDVVGFASRPGADGPVYEALSRAPLLGEKSMAPS